MKYCLLFKKYLLIFNCNIKYYFKRRDDINALIYLIICNIVFWDDKTEGMFNMIKKLSAIISIVLVASVLFTVNCFAAENYDFDGEINIATDYVIGEILVGTQDSGNNETIESVKQEYSLGAYELLLSDTQSNGSVTSIYKTTFTQQDNIAALCYDIGSESGVLYAEPNYIGSTESVDTQEANQQPTMPWYLNELGYYEFNQYLDSNNVTLREITIAVLDTGVDVNDQDLSSHFVDIEDEDGNVYHGIDATTSTISYDVDDVQGHGTAVISSIVSSGYAGIDAGVNKNVKILPIKIYGSAERIEDTEENCSIALSNILRAINYIAGDGKIVDADIINLSSGFYKNTDDDSENVLQSLQIAVKKAESEKIVFVASAGNANDYLYDSNGEYNTERIVYPAAYESVIGVMASDERGERASYSNFGLPNGSEYPLGYDLIAPGTNILLKNQNEDGGYIYSFVSGTSFSSPITAGVIAYYMAMKPASYFESKTIQNIKAELLSLFTSRPYTYAHGTVPITENVPTVNLFDVIAAFDSDFECAKTQVEISYNLEANDNGLTLNISNVSSIPDFKSIYDTPWCNQSNNITEINIYANSADLYLGDYAFTCFRNLEKVNFHNNGTNALNISIGNSTFSNCISLKNFDFSNVRSIGTFAFSYCNCLQDVDLSNTLVAKEFAFALCTGITILTLPSQNFRVSDGLFSSCILLTSVDLQGATYIGDYSFICDLNLANITFPKIGNVSIGTSAFQYCKLSTVLTFTDAITSIGDYAFRHCSQNTLKYVIFMNPDVGIGIKAFQDLYDSEGNEYSDGYMFFGYPDSTAFDYLCSEYNGNIAYTLLPDLVSIEGSTCVIDRERRLIYGLRESLTEEDLFDDYLTVTNTSVSSYYEVEYRVEDTVGTGMKIKLYSKNGDNIVYQDDYTVVLFGDCNGDGEIDISDVSTANRMLRNGNFTDPIFYTALDLTYFGDGVTNEDVEVLLNACSGTIDLMQTINEGSYVLPSDSDED